MNLPDLAKEEPEVQDGKQKKRATALNNLRKAKGLDPAREFPLEKYIDLKALERAAEADLTEKQLAIVLDITQKQLRRLARRADFIEILQRGKAQAKKIVESSLFAAATGVHWDEVTRERVLIGRVRQIKEKPDKAGPIDAQLTAGSGHGQERIYSVHNALVITKTVRKFIPPDTEAIKFYLSNVDPISWKIRTQTDANLTRKVEVAELAGRNRDALLELKKKINDRVAQVKAAGVSAVRN